MEPITKKKTKSQPKKNTKKKSTEKNTMKKKTVKKKTVNKKRRSEKDLFEDKATESESEVSWDEEADADMHSDEEDEADMHSDKEVESEADIHSDKEVEAEEVEAEVVSDEEVDEEVKIKIKSHHFVKGVCWLKTKFPDEDGIMEVEVWWLWYEFKNQLREYIKKRKLKGNAWHEPNANHATKIVAVLGDCDKELHILWNNGYHEWATEELVLADKQSFVEENLLDVYWKGKKKEPVKKSTKKKSKKK